MSWTQNDQAPAGTFTLSSDGVPANLTGATIIMHCRRESDGTVFSRNVGGNGLTILSNVAGTISYIPQVTDLTLAGTYLFEFQVTWSGPVGPQTFRQWREYVNPEIA